VPVEWGPAGPVSTEEIAGQVIYYVPGEDEDYHSHWIQIGLILEMIVPSESEAAQKHGERNGS
jgi:hypothetical protein